MRRHERSPQELVPNEIGWMFRRGPAPTTCLRRTAAPGRRSPGCSERPDHTLQATALVHEAYLRLLGSANGNDWENRGHFFAAASEAMRRILVESARSKQCSKRGGKHRRLEFLEFSLLDDESPEMLLDIDEALTQLAMEDAESAKLVQMRLFAGLSVTEAGKALGMSRSRAYENWAFARSWLTVHFGTSSE